MRPISRLTAFSIALTLLLGGWWLLFRRSQVNLLRAVRQHDLAAVEEGLRLRVSLEDHDDNYTTPLLLAATLGEDEIAKRLIDAGASIHASDVHGQTVLMRACARGDLELVSLLLDRGARIDDISGLDGRGYTALWFAAFNGRLAIVRKLLKAPHHTYEPRSEALNQALLGAAEYGDPTTVKLLLQSGAYINCTDYSGTTPLMAAAQAGNLAAAEALLKLGADTRPLGTGGTAMQLAKRNHHSRIVDLFKWFGARE